MAAAFLFAVQICLWHMLSRLCSIIRYLIWNSWMTRSLVQLCLEKHSVCGSPVVHDQIPNIESTKAHFIENRPFLLAK